MNARRSLQTLGVTLSTISSTAIAGISHARSSLPHLRVSQCIICKHNIGYTPRCYSSRQRMRPSNTPTAPPLPILEELRAEIRKPGSPYVEASDEGYYEALQVYAEAVNARAGGRWWAVTFPSRKTQPSLKLIHHLACMIRDIVPASQLYWMGMWGWASEQGFVPSTIQLVSSMNIVRAFNAERWEKRPDFVKRAEIKFRQLVKMGNDPNVLTVEAEWLRFAGKPQACVDMLGKAFQVGGDKFELLPSAKVALATALNDCGRCSDARRVLESVSVLAPTESNLQMGRALAEEDPVTAREWFYKASLLGIDEGFEGLVRMEDRIIEMAEDSEVAKKHMHMRNEWEKMAKSGL